MAICRPDPFAYLTGRLSRSTLPPEITAPGEGGKFDPSGQVLPFAGNTFIFHIDKASDGFAALVEMQDALKAGPSSGAFSFLPPSSFHMTVFNGISGPNPSVWPEDIARDTPPSEVTEEIGRRVAGLDVPTGLEVTSRDLFAGHSLTMAGLDDADESALRALRERLRNATGLRADDFDSYVFHITFGYLLRWLDDDEATALITLSDALHDRLADRLGHFQLAHPEYCVFETMHHFECVALLGKQASGA